MIALRLDPHEVRNWLVTETNLVTAAFRVMTFVVHPLRTTRGTEACENPKAFDRLFGDSIDDCSGHRQIAQFEKIFRVAGRNPFTIGLTAGWE